MTGIGKALVILAALVATVWIGYDLLRKNDLSQLQISVDGPLKIWRDLDSLSTDQPLAVLSRGQSLPVTDCVYGKDSLDYRVRLPDGRSGYVIAGEAFHVNGPGGPLPGYPQEHCK